MSEPLEPIEALVKRDLSGWAKFIFNCSTGDNYFRASEYHDLIRTLDNYARKLDAMTTERDALLADAKLCICKINFRDIVKEYEPNFGRRYRDKHGDEYVFSGILLAEDDFYYCMWRNECTRLLSCVVAIDAFGFELIDGKGKKP